jgi:2-dehydro-3-deoxyphosphooctonate aldolase (KDO 8-P synthase)
VRLVQVGPIRIGDGQPLAFIAGPCVIESPAHALETAQALAAIAARCKVPLVFKAFRC